MEIYKLEKKINFLKSFSVSIIQLKKLNTKNIIEKKNFQQEKYKKILVSNKKNYRISTKINTDDSYNKKFFPTTAFLLIKYKLLFYFLLFGFFITTIYLLIKLSFKIKHLSEINLMNNINTAPGNKKYGYLNQQEENVNIKDRKFSKESSNYLFFYFLSVLFILF